MNDGDQAINFLYLVGCLVLVASALMVRRMPIASGLKMFAGWILIFLAFFAIFALKDDFIALGKRLVQDGRGEGAIVAAGETLRIKKSQDGHFWVNGKINGEDVRFLVDSGATVTSLSAGTARHAAVEERGGFPVMVDTANGTIEVQRGRAQRLMVGTIERHDLPVHVSEAFGDTNVLGMNFLSSLSGWGVEGQWLVLRP